MKAVILGATKGMGRAIARLMAERGDQLYILGIGVEDLERTVRDLNVRGKSTQIRFAECDLERSESFGPALDEADNALLGFDAVIVTAGIFASQDTLESDSELTSRLLRINFTNTILFCEEARKRLLARGGGVLCVFSSVAGDRGRKPVVLYGATKAGLSYYLEGLDHKYREQGLRTICVKPGFVKTSMTAGLKPPPFAGEPEEVAKLVLRAIEHGTPMVYAPKPWKYVMMVIRSLPRTLMRRIGF